ncbi:sulfite exporter TauE/SafE family protein [Vaginella massiliensis]|uniref:sulfite exporter TauE/SafE family protein n=1 Tax=Vaginella massiliensis TaxID=1816680 RepID=UPI0008381116|nr:sulfite exporter TauE/SafE family protein [Vaginella massiliensis]
MSLEEIIGFVSALFIGLVLGLMGGGGSILAVPVLAYLFDFDEKVATAYSLFIVGSTSLVGGIKQAINKMVDWRAVFIFGIPAVVGVSIVRLFVVPNLPENLFKIGDFMVTRRMGMFGLFSVLMLFAAISILSNRQGPLRKQKSKFHPLLLSEGFFIGSLTGLVGAGGGFLIVPALMVIAQLEIKRAAATSLFIIATNSLIGFFIGDVMHLEIDWLFLLEFVSISMIGILIGTYLAKKVSTPKMKRMFAFFIIAMAIFIFIEEFILN